MKRIVAVVAVFAISGGAIAVAYASQSPRALRTAILHAARAQQSVHWVQKSRYPHSVVTIVSDVAATEGSQQVTMKAGKTAARLKVELVDQTAYVKGNVDGLVLLQGLTQSQAQAYVNQWISIPKGDEAYAGAVYGLTLPSIVGSLSPHGHLSIVSAKRHGKAVVGVRGILGKGKKKEDDVLYAPARGKKLPLEQDQSDAGYGFSARTVLSNWNEAVSVTAPASSTPIATVRGS
jgi:hypothetical protein